MHHSLTPKAYGQFLCRLFNLWYEDWAKGNYHSIRLFDDNINIMLGSPSGTTCVTCGQCGGYFVVEGDGSVYLCDFFALDRWKMGNIRENSLMELASSKQAVEFLQWGRENPSECADCRWRSLCNGGCKNNWERSGHLTITTVKPPAHLLCSCRNKTAHHCQSRITGKTRLAAPWVSLTTQVTKI